MYMYGEFECIRGILADMGIKLKVCSREDHIPGAEHNIRTIKDRVRCVLNILPFKKVPDRMLINMVYSSVFWLNAFPCKNGVSKQLSPRLIVTGNRIDYNKHCTLECGQYVQTHEQHDNSMVQRTTGAICMRPTGNTQGGYYFYSLSTGRIINRRAWTALDMPNEVIDRVHKMSRRKTNGIDFTDRNGNVYDDDTSDTESTHSQDSSSIYNERSNNDSSDNTVSSNDSSYIPDETSDSDTDLDHDDNSDVSITGVERNTNVNSECDEDSDSSIAGVGNANDDNDDDKTTGVGNAKDGNDDDGIINNVSQPPILILRLTVPVRHETPPVEFMDEPTDSPDIIAAKMDAKYGKRTNPHQMRRRKRRDYSHLHTSTHKRKQWTHKPKDYGHFHAMQHVQECQMHYYDIMLTQYHLKKGLKTYKEDGADTVKKN